MVSDEEEPHDLRAPRVEARVRLDVELVADYRPPASLLVVAVAAAAVDVDFVRDRSGGVVVAVHVDERLGNWGIRVRVCLWGKEGFVSVRCGSLRCGGPVLLELVSQ